MNATSRHSLPRLVPGLLHLVLLAAVVAGLPRARGQGEPSLGPDAEIVQNGQTRPGRVVGDAASGFRFDSAGEPAPLPLATVSEVRFLPDDTATDPAASSAPFWVDLGLRGRISGRLLGLDEDAVHLETSLSEMPLAIRRVGLHALVQRPGEAQVLAEDFEAESLDTMRWAIVGRPTLIENPVAQGARSLRLAPGGSAVTTRLPAPVEAGRFELSYRDDGQVARGPNRLVDLAFRGPDGLQSIQILLGWKEATLGVLRRGNGPPLALQPLEREEGWLRLEVRFGPERTDVTVDGLELAHGKGPGGPLVEIRLASEAVDRESRLDASFDDLRLVRFAEAPSFVEVDPDQDEARLIAGDQLFGTVRQANSEQILLVLRQQDVMLSWSEVAGLHFRRQVAPSAPLDGLWVHAWWRPDGFRESSRDLDHLEGVLEAIDAEGATLRVPYVGTVRVPRRRLQTLTILGGAERIEIDPNRRHLGNRVVADLDPPQPEGTTLSLPFVLLGKAPPDMTLLAIDVVQAIGVEGDPSYSRQVRDGEMRTVVFLNDRQLGDLNSPITTRNDVPIRVRLPIPPGLLQDGENLLRFEQGGTRDDPELVDNLGLLGIALERPSLEQRREQP